jgi:CheY-like chemotaxis protein
MSRLSDSLKPGKYVHLSVKDTGCGIRPEIIGKIFDPYFTTKEVGKGSGLGLAVVQGIVNSHNGLITAESEQFKGSTFHVYFPFSEGKIQGKKLDKVFDIPLGTEKILFVDDEDMIVNFSQKILGHLGYKAESKTNPLEALNLFKSAPGYFDLVVTDMSMPEITGDNLAKEILKIRPDIPVILCTGYNEKIDEEKAKKIGIRGYIMKPIEVIDLARVIRKTSDNPISDL